jgi:hypothetical protein
VPEGLLGLRHLQQWRQGVRIPREDSGAGGKEMDKGKADNANSPINKGLLILSLRHLPHVVNRDCTM